MGRVIPAFSKHVLVLLVAEVQQFSMSAYIDAIQYTAMRRHCNFCLVSCDGSEQVEHIIKDLKEGKYRGVWCFGECANSLALSICKSARAAQISIHNFTRADVAAHKAYDVFATHSRLGVY